MIAALMSDLLQSHRMPTDAEVDLILAHGTPTDVADALCVTCATNPKLLKRYNKDRRGR